MGSAVAVVVNARKMLLLFMLLNIDIVIALGTRVVSTTSNLICCGAIFLGLS